MLNWIKSIFVPQTPAAMPKTPAAMPKPRTAPRWGAKARKPIRGHYRTYKSGKKVWVEARQKH